MCISKNLEGEQFMISEVGLLLFPSPSSQERNYLFPSLQELRRITVVKVWGWKTLDFSSTLGGLQHNYVHNLQFSYLSRMIRYSIKATYLETSPQINFVHAANQIGRWMSSRRLKKLNDEQRKAIKREMKIQDFYECKARLHDDIRKVRPHQESNRARSV